MEQILFKIVIGYLVLINIAGYLIMGIDKMKAVKKEWRIPERTLFAIALLGGGVGAFLGMFTFRHKTRHLKFVILFTVCAVIDVFLIYQLLRFMK